VATRARKFCLKCGGEMRVEARKCRHCGAWADEDARRELRSAPRPEPPASLSASAVFTLLAYFVFWVPGAILNWHFLGEARKAKERSGLEPAGTPALKAMIWLFVYLPLIALALASAAFLIGSAVAVS
jgi:hypothetical protein